MDKIRSKLSEPLLAVVVILIAAAIAGLVSGGSTNGSFVAMFGSGPSAVHAAHEMLQIVGAFFSP